MSGQSRLLVLVFAEKEKGRKEGNEEGKEEGGKRRREKTRGGWECVLCSVCVPLALFLLAWETSQPTTAAVFAYRVISTFQSQEVCPTVQLKGNTF